MNPKTVAYIHALIIDSILIVFDSIINSQAHEHEGAMVEEYSKMKPDAFKLQLQIVLTAYYEDIKGVAGTKSKVVKCKFEDQDNTGNMQDNSAANATDAADAAATTPATPPDGGAAAASGGEDPPPAPSPAGKEGSSKGQAGGGPKRSGKALG